MKLIDDLRNRYNGRRISVGGQLGTIVAADQSMGDLPGRATIIFDGGMKTWHWYEDIDLIDNNPLPLPG